MPSGNRRARCRAPLAAASNFEGGLAMSVFEAPSSEASWPSEAEQVFAAGEAFETRDG